MFLLATIRYPKKSCKIALFSSKSANESLKPSTIFGLDLMICPLMVHGTLGCMCVTALLTFLEARLIYP